MVWGENVHPLRGMTIGANIHFRTAALALLRFIGYAARHVTGPQYVEALNARLQRQSAQAQFELLKVQCR